MSFELPNNRVRTVDYFSGGFGTMRVANPYPMLDVSFYNGIPALRMESLPAGGGSISHISSTRTVRLSVGGTNADRERFRSTDYVRYQSGKSTRVGITVSHSNAGNSNQTRRWGLFDDNNGVYFELSGTTLNVVILNNGTPTVVPSASWASTSTPTLTNLNLYEIDFEWLGGGDIRFFINKQLKHTIPGNTAAGPYMQTGRLPAQLEIVNTAASSAGSIDCACIYADSNGGHEQPSEAFSYGNLSAISIPGTAEIPILSMRPRSLFNTFENRRVAHPTRFGLSSDGNRASCRLLMNPTTLTGATYAVSASANSAFEFDIAATAFTGGEEVARFYVDANPGYFESTLDDVFGELRRGVRRNAFNTGGDVLLVVAASRSGTNTDVRASVRYVER